MTNEPGSGRAAAHLDATDRQYRSLFENMHEGLALCQMYWVDGRPDDFAYLDVNAAFEAQTGLRDVVGKRVSEVIPGLRDSDPELFERYGRVAAGGPSERFEMHVEAMDMWFSIAAYCPEVGRFIAVFDVITDRVLVERALRNANSILERTEAISHVASWRLDLGTGVVTWSREMYRIFGLAVAESEVGDPGLIENAVFPEDRANYEAARASIRAGEPRDMEYRIICTDGSIRWVHAEGELETDDDGKAVSIAGFVQDITERKEAEIALAQAQKMEAVGRLAGGVAHDFNNLLTAIGGYARILEMDLAAGVANPEDAAEIRKAADRAAALTARLLAFAGRQTVRPVIMDLVSAIEQMLPMLRRIVPERIQIDTVLLPTPPIEADPGEIDQVILNLIVNAADSIAGIGKIRVETTTVEHDGDLVRAHPGSLRGLHARLVVGDTGIGMDGEVRARIFEPFFTTKDRSQGTGLGLSTVHGVVERMQAVIEVNSEPNVGSEFRIDIPATDSVEPSVAEAPEEAAGRGTERILLVEDEPMVRQFVSSTLFRLGYTVIEAARPEDAVAAIASDYDLLVTDVIMPGMDGGELVRVLRSSRPHLPVLFVSGYSHGTVGQLPLDEPRTAMLSKPFTPISLGRAARRLLDQ